jgi:hypothetical protein
MQGDGFSLPWRERVRVRGQKQAPSPLSSPVKGEEVSEHTVGDRSIRLSLIVFGLAARVSVLY